MSAPASDAARGAARLAAVQALYQMELAGVGAEEVAEEFIAHRFDETPHRHGFFPPSSKACRSTRSRSTGPSPPACRKTGPWRGWIPSCAPSCAPAVFELVARRDVPAKVVIDEYVGIAHDFFAGDEPGFVNAALDRMAAASGRRNSACRFPTTN